MVRREANSEYRRRTSRSCSQSANAPPDSTHAYSSPDSICDVATAAFLTFACVGDDDLKIVVLAQYLLYSAVVTTPLLYGIRILFIVTQVLGPRDGIWLSVVCILVS